MPATKRFPGGLLPLILLLLSVPALRAEDAAQLRSISGAFRAAAARIRPSVVAIETTYQSSQQAGRRDFGGAAPGAEESALCQKGEGTGVVFDKDGFIVTSHHVIEGADEIKVVLDDNREFKARLVGSDPKTDLALLKIDAAVEAVQCGDSDLAQVGDWAIAIGNAMGFKQTVTVGIISAKGRTGLRDEDDAYEDFLQTDAAINRGNSGGPLCDIDGKVIGINAMIASNTGGSQGLGFAIPINMVKNVVQQLKECGRVNRGYLGVTIDNLSARLARHFGYSGSDGAVVTEVEEGSPAMKAGLKPGDIILAAGGRPVNDSLMLRNLVARLKPGSPLPMEIVRKGGKMKVNAEIGSFSEGPESEDASLGLRLRRAEGAEVAQYGAKGVIVQAVRPGSPADACGLRPGMLIASVDQVPTEAPEDFLKKALAAINGKNGEALLYVKSGEGGFFAVMAKE